MGMKLYQAQDASGHASCCMYVLGLVTGGVYKLNLTVRRDGHVVWQEERHFEEVSGQGSYFVEFGLPSGVTGLHDVTVNVYDSFPGLDEDGSFLCKVTRNMNFGSI